MYRPRSKRTATVAVLGVAFGIATGLSGTASADTGSCVSYLERQGEDNTVRVQLCAETETLGDTVSQQYALAVCVPGMSLTGLPEPQAVESCHLAAEP